HLSIITFYSLYVYVSIFLFSFTVTRTPKFYTLSLHDALPISSAWKAEVLPLNYTRLITIMGRLMGIEPTNVGTTIRCVNHFATRSEEHTSELQSRFDIVCRLLLEKKKRIK